MVEGNKVLLEKVEILKDVANSLRIFFGVKKFF
jgi:hypothetical protein